MTEPRSHDELRDLLGVFALDALDPDEAAAVEAHIAGCEDCRTELRQLHTVAGMLGTTTTSAPPELWNKIADHLDVPAPRPLRPPPVPRVTLTRPWALIAAAAVIVLLAGLASLGALALHQQRQIDRSNRSLASGSAQQTIEQAALAASTAPGARRVALIDRHGATVATVVLVPGSTSYLIPVAMPTLATTRTYQLWGKHGSTLVSLSVLGARPGATPIAVPADLQALAVSTELAPGAVTPTTPLAEAALT